MQPGPLETAERHVRHALEMQTQHVVPTLVCVRAVGVLEHPRALAEGAFEENGAVGAVAARASARGEARALGGVFAAANATLAVAALGVAGARLLLVKGVAQAPDATLCKAAVFCFSADSAALPQIAHVVDAPMTHRALLGLRAGTTRGRIEKSTFEPDTSLSG